MAEQVEKSEVAERDQEGAEQESDWESLCGEGLHPETEGEEEPIPIAVWEKAQGGLHQAAFQLDGFSEEKYPAENKLS